MGVTEAVPPAKMVRVSFLDDKGKSNPADDEWLSVRSDRLRKPPGTPPCPSPINSKP